MSKKTDIYIDLGWKLVLLTTEVRRSRVRVNRVYQTKSNEKEKKLAFEQPERRVMRKIFAVKESRCDEDGGRGKIWMKVSRDQKDNERYEKEFLYGQSVRDSTARFSDNIRHFMHV